MNGSNSENDIELTATRPLGTAVPSVHAASKPNGGFEGTTVQSWWSILVAEEDPADPLAVKVIQEIEDWVVSLFIGFFVVSYWRGTWTLLDIWGCDQPQDASLTNGNTFCLAADPKDRLRSAWITYLCGIVLTFLGVAWLWTGFWHPRASADGKVYTKIRKRRMVARFVIVYTLGMAAVCQVRTSNNAKNRTVSRICLTLFFCKTTPVAWNMVPYRRHVKGSTTDRWHIHLRRANASRFVVAVGWVWRRGGSSLVIHGVPAGSARHLFARRSQRRSASHWSHGSLVILFLDRTM